MLPEPSLHGETLDALSPESLPCHKGHRHLAYFRLNSQGIGTKSSVPQEAARLHCLPSGGSPSASNRSHTPEQSLARFLMQLRAPRGPGLEQVFHHSSVNSNQCMIVTSMGFHLPLSYGLRVCHHPGLEPLGPPLGLLCSYSQPYLLCVLQTCGSGAFLHSALCSSPLQPQLYPEPAPPTD